MVRQQLPKKWCIKITKENKEILTNWRDFKTLTNNTIGGYLVNKRLTTVGYYYSLRPNDYEEITFEEFEIHILKTKPLLSIIEVW